MPGFSAGARSPDTEWMDTETVPYEDFRACLVDLSSVNRLSFGYRPTLRFLDRLRREGRLPAGRPLAIVDAGSGYGDTLRAVARWGAANGVALRLTGVDLNPWSTRAATEASPGLDISFVTDDVFAYATRSGEPPDVVLSALFTHHLSDRQVVDFLRWMESTARIGWFVNDLHRHALSYFGFSAIATLARWHRFVRHDGPVSIARGFVRADWDRLLGAAGLSGAATVRWWTPFRLCVERVKP
jgi:SAM-dependent methyltransferase